MTKLEFFIAYAENLRVPFIFLLIGATIGAVISGICMLNDDCSSSDRAWAARVFKTTLSITLLVLPICCLPSSDNLWRVRVNMVKLQLASPENIEGGVKHIDELAKDLECRYLAHCPKEEKKKE